MARGRGILDRLRPAGAPGGAARAGVPVDRLETLGSELAPLFEQLRPVLQECQRLTQEATASARQREADAARRAQDLVARARTESEADRADAATAARATVASETEHSLAEARQEADHLRLRAEQRRPQLLARVLDLVREDLRSFGEGAGESSAP